MRYPVDPKVFKITQKFGVNPQPFQPKGHNGIDFATPVGTPVRAPHAGVISRGFEQGGFGIFAKIDSAKEGSRLAHLSKISVANGTVVKEGQIIGYTGNTGLSTGPHLHWSYFRNPRNSNNGYFGFINPEPFIGGGDDMTNEKDVKRRFRGFLMKEAGSADIKTFTNRSQEYVDTTLLASTDRKKVEAQYKAGSDLKKEVGKLQGVISTKDETIKALTGDLAGLQTANKELLAEKAKLEAEVASLNTKTEALNGKIEETTNKLPMDGRSNVPRRGDWTIVILSKALRNLVVRFFKKTSV